MIRWLNHKQIDHDRIRGILSESEEANHFTNFGPVSRKLEERLHKLLQIDINKSVVVTSSGTAALHALVSTFNKIKGYELMFDVPAFTFPSAAQGSSSYCSIIDVNDTMGPDIYDVRNDGFIMTNVFGNVIKLEHYENFAKKNNKILIYDNAATPFTFYQGTNCLNRGDGSFISLHHTKPLGFGEGGAVIIDKKYESIVRQMINFGFDDGKWSEWGSNWKMSDIAAAYIYAYLDKFERIVEMHIILYNYFKRNLPSHATLYPNFSDGTPFVSCLPILMDKPINFASSDIEVKKYYKPLKDLHNAQSFYDRTICFPCHVDIMPRHVDFMLEAISNLGKINV